MKLFRQEILHLALLVIAVATILPMTVVAQEQDNETLDLEHVKQQAMELKQSVLTATETQRQALVKEAEAALANFDARIERLENNITENSEDMSASAKEYANEMMSTLTRQRDELGQWFNSLQVESEKAWDEVIYGFSRAYDEFYDSWQDLEGQFGAEPLY